MTLRRFKTVALLLCAACLALAGWMLFHSLTGARMAGCGAGSGCDSVMGSPWAYVLGGVPVSLPAAVAYLLLALCLVFLGGETAEDALRFANACGAICTTAVGAGTALKSREQVLNFLKTRQ